MEILKTNPSILFSISLIVILLLAPVSADAATAALLDVKFAYINNFTKYVTWPPKTFENDTSTFRACVVGDNALFDSFESYSREIVTTFKIRTMRIRNAADAEKCHFIYFGESSDPAMSGKILKSVERNPILTIGESPSFIHQGGIIRFVVADKKLAFEINPAAAKRSGLEVSFKILKLAKIVSEQP